LNFCHNRLRWRSVYCLCHKKLKFSVVIALHLRTLSMDDWALFYNGLMPSKKLIAVAALSKAWIWGLSYAGIAGSNSAGLEVGAGEAWMSVSCECYVLLVRGLCDGPIRCPVEFYRMCTSLWV